MNNEYFLVLAKFVSLPVEIPVQLLFGQGCYLLVESNFFEGRLRLLLEWFDWCVCQHNLLVGRNALQGALMGVFQWRVRVSGGIIQWLLLIHSPLYSSSRRALHVVTLVLEQLALSPGLYALLRLYKLRDGSVSTLIHCVLELIIIVLAHVQLFFQLLIDGVHLATKQFGLF